MAGSANRCYKRGGGTKQQMYLCADSSSKVKADNSANPEIMSVVLGVALAVNGEHSCLDVGGEVLGKVKGYQICNLWPFASE